MLDLVIAKEGRNENKYVDETPDAFVSVVLAFMCSLFSPQSMLLPCMMNWPSRDDTALVHSYCLHLNV